MEDITNQCENNEEKRGSQDTDMLKSLKLERSILIELKTEEAAASEHETAPDGGIALNEIVLATDEIGAAAANRRGASKQPSRSAQRPFQRGNVGIIRSPIPRLVPTRLEEVREVWPETRGQACWYHKLGSTRPSSHNAFSRAPSALQESTSSAAAKNRVHHRKPRRGL